MGCDIHCYIEFRDKNHDPEWLHWQSFGGRINPGRHYEVFANLAGVRNYNEVKPVVPPRGFPEDYGSYAGDDNYLFITETEGEGYCTRDRAEQWVKANHSKWKDSDQKFVTSPDWHSHSWMTPDEWESALKIVERLDPRYTAITAALRSFESQGYNARIVFWFDN